MANFEYPASQRSQQSAISKNLSTAEGAEPPQQAKTGLAGDPGDAKENGGLPRINADERGSEEQNLPLINTEDTDLSGAVGKILPQAVSEVYANRSQTAEVHANLG